MWLSLAAFVLKLVLPYLFGQAGKSGEIPDALAKQAIKNAENSLALIDKARAARDAATGRFDKSGGVPDDKDPNLRD